MRFALLICVVALGLILHACNETTSDNPNAQPKAVMLPDQIMTNAEIYLTSEGIRKATIKSESLKVYSRLDTTLMYQVEVKFFDTTGAHTSTLTSDSAWVSQRANKMTVIGHVRGTTKENRRLVADSLRWDARSERILTEGYVEIYRGEDLLTGYGLETDQRLEQVIIKRKPRGTFNEPDQRTR
jgi:LPS export ABC transporter protein LptC